MTAPDPMLGPIGLFVARGTGIRIPPGGLVFTLDASGVPTAASLERIEVSLDMCAIWMRIALDQLDSCVAAYEQGIAASRHSDDEGLGRSLDAECAAGMLAVASSAFALDALYAALKERSPRVQGIPISKRGRSARYRIVVEAIRREFRVGPKSFSNVMAIVSQVFRFRDYAVHPRASFAAPVLKAEVRRLTEWRFVTFGAPSAQNAVRGVLALCLQLPSLARNPNADVRNYLDGLQAAIADLAIRWRARYGVLTDTE